jgi:hypothetical protein
LGHKSNQNYLGVSFWGAPFFNNPPSYSTLLFAVRTDVKDCPLADKSRHFEKKWFRGAVTMDGDIDLQLRHSRDGC